MAAFFFGSHHFLMETAKMTKTNENNDAPKLDRSKVRKFREIARYTLEDCVLESDLAEDWRKIERGEYRAIGREMVFDIVDFLGCETEDLLTEKCPESELPEMIYLCDSETWVYSPEPDSGLRVKVETEGRQNFLRIHCEDATPEEMENIWAMLTKGVTA
jgi:hypothetical protein